LAKARAIPLAPCARAAHIAAMLLAALVILVGFGPGQGADQPTPGDGAAAVSSRLSPDMSHDQTARFLARRLGRHLPGQPRVEARQAPGAAGLAAAAALARAPADGSVIALLSSNVVQASALGMAGGRFDAAAFVWLGGVAREGFACAARPDAQAPFWFAAAGPGGRAAVHARGLIDLAGVEGRVLAGYGGSGEIVRALESGEANVACGWSLRELEARRPDWLKGAMDLPAVFAGRAQGLWIDRADAQSRALLDALAGEGEYAHALAGPPGLPAPLAEAFEGALEALASDREAVEDAARAGVALDPAPAAEVTARVRALHGLPEPEKARLRRLFAR
jgi:tripartite-type tricarboxylate transporter receptor subunit TctC